MKLVKGFAKLIEEELKNSVDCGDILEEDKTRIMIAIDTEDYYDLSAGDWLLLADYFDNFLDVSDKSLSDTEEFTLMTLRDLCFLEGGATTETIGA